MGEVKEQDKDSGLVWREVVRERTPRGLGRGVLTEETLEGKQVEARFINDQGHVQRVAGTVRRNDAGRLIVESWADGVRSQTPVTRDANVEVIRREPSR